MVDTCTQKRHKATEWVTMSKKTWHEGRGVRERESVKTRCGGKKVDLNIYKLIESFIKVVGARHGKKFSNLKFSANDAKSLFESIRLFSSFSVARFCTHCRRHRCCCRCYCCHCHCWLPRRLPSSFFPIHFYVCSMKNSARLLFFPLASHHFKRVPFSENFPADDILSYIHILYLLLYKESCCLCHSWQSHHRSNSFSVVPFVKIYFRYRMYLSCMIVRAAYIFVLVLLV